MGDYNNYELIEKREISDINSLGYIFKHTKSGARVVVISNDDDNKVFNIGFRTTPMEDTGVPHILEHSVLCGSTSFPVKDPFIELAKGSLNTFLNAMTFPDKTMYPIASYNDKDFKNLMHIYMDAVFYPNILKTDKSFLQEGWHYELESLESPLEINGVVYNEMKGAYSSSDEILSSKVMNTLFPDNTYGRDSGGNPAVIPELTYEHYLEFYHKYYHPSNSFIFLYGDMDVEERLAWMDEMYLSKFDYLEVDSSVLEQKPFDVMKNVSVEFPITEDENENETAILSYSKVVDTILDTNLYFAFEVLSYVLGSAPGAPIKQALLDAGIGQDVFASYNGEMYQPFFKFTAKNTDVALKDKFVSVIEETLKSVVKDGLDKEALLGSINSSEFRFREADYGQWPKGLMYSLVMFESWLYDESKPFLHLECLKTYQFLRDMVETDYFEQLVQKYLIDNQHGAVVVAVPKKGLADENEKKLKDELAKIKASMTDDELKNIIRNTNELRAYQEAEDSPEAIATIPVLSREDIRKEEHPFSNVELNVAGTKAVLHDYETNGIEYISFLFDVNDVKTEELPYVGLLRDVLGYIDTEKYSYKEYANKVNMYTGGVDCLLNIYPVLTKENTVDGRIEIKVRTLSNQIEKAMELVEQMVFSSKFEDGKRFKEIIGQAKARLQERLSAAGHLTAATRSLSNTSVLAFYQDMTTGIGYYKAICEIEKKLLSDEKEVLLTFAELVQRVFTKERLLLSYTNTKESFEGVKTFLEEFVNKLPVVDNYGQRNVVSFNSRKEGFTDASQIQYVAKGGNFLNKGFAYTGALKILKVILGYDYLWNNVRVKGGAYGCMNTFMRTGDAYFVSYRDPNLTKTIEVYNNIPSYVKNFDASEDEMTKYIVGTFGAIDTPLTPDGKGYRSLSAYLEGLTYEDVQKERDEILCASTDDIKKLASLVEAVLKDELICVVGNENAIKDNRDLFDEVSGLTE